MKTVLIIDDDAEMLSLLEAILSDKYRVLKAENGAKGIEIFDQEKVDVTITDLMMPVMDGEEFIKNLNQKGLRPIICITGASNSFLKKIVNIYIDKIVLKPFEPKDILKSVEEVLFVKKKSEQ